MKIFVLVLLIVFSGLSQAKKPFQLYSTGFKNNGEIPLLYTCQGGDVSPPLLWTGKPDSAKSFALIITDYDAIKVAGHPVVHWVVYNIPPNISAFDTGTSSVIAGLNSYGKKGYAGMCPPAGDVHHYYFDLYALDTVTLDVPSSPVAAQVTGAIQGHIIAEASLVARYKKH